MDKKILVFLSLILSGCGGEDGNNITTTSNETEDDSNVQEIVYLNGSDRSSERSTFLKREVYHAEIEGDKVDKKYLTEENIIKIAKIIDNFNSSEFSKKTLGAIYSDFDSSGNEFFIINFLEGGYFLLNTSINDNVIHYVNNSEFYAGVPICSDCNFTVSLDWMSIIATEVTLPTTKLRKSAARTASRELVTKITWDSGSSRSDFDLFIKSPDGEICNWQTSNKDKSKWGAKHLRDDQGGSYKRSYEAFSVDLDIMDSYASKNNLFSNDNGNYKFYIARYTGPDINYNFSYGLNGECSAYNSNDCSKGNWKNNVGSTGISNASYAVRYTPQRVSTSSLSDDELLVKYSPLMAFDKNDKTPVPVDAFLKYSVLYNIGIIARDTADGIPNNIVAFGASLPASLKAKKTTTYYYGAGSTTGTSSITFTPSQKITENHTMPSGGEYFLDFRNGNDGGKDHVVHYFDQFYKDFELDKSISYSPNDVTNSYGKSIYGRVLRVSGKIYLQYYFFYLMNDWDGATGFHEGDWEGMIVELDSDQNPLRVGVSIHLTGEVKEWSEATKKSDHPVVYIGYGGHPTYFTKGTTGQYVGTDYHNKDDRILYYKGSSEKGKSINGNAIKTPYDIINIETDASTKSWLTSNVYWGEDYLDTGGKSVASPGSNKSHDQDRWSNPKKWLDDKE